MFSSLLSFFAGVFSLCSLKTNDILRSVDQHLGIPINSFLIMARYCNRGIRQATLQRDHSLGTRLSLFGESLKVAARFRVLGAEPELSIVDIVCSSCLVLM